MVLHAGGVLQDGQIPSQTLHSVRGVYAPKLLGAENLMKFAGPLPCQGLQAFSSVAATMGSPGQSNYAAANSALDAYLSSLAGCGVQGDAIHTACKPGA